VGGSTVDLVAAGCEGLGEGRVLRDLLRPGRFLGLLPLLHFLREVSGKLAWSAPPPRALVIFDDPNLHWTSYGYLKLRELARSARTHGYHVAFATIPLDGFFAHPAAVRILRERSGEMSLVVHGAEHEGAELLRSRPGDQTRSLLAQALRRIESFEGRTGLRVERVMVPPHGVCSHETLRAMLALDFEAVCTFWPFPEPPGTPPPGWPLAGWEPAQLLGGGLPVLSRYPFAGHPLDDLVFRAFLDQPLILFGHHDDLAGGFDRLLEAVEFVQGLGAVTWMSAGGIARTNLFTRREERTLRVRLFTRRASVEVPAGVDSVIVELPPAHGPEGRQHLLTSAGRTGLVTSNTRPARVMLSVGAGRLDLRLASETALDPGRLEAPPRRIRPLVRRLATETRDRLDPALRRVLR
jgi:hypothetical protein